MSRPAPDAEEEVAVVTGVGSDSVFHAVEDGEPACGPAIRSNNFRVTARGALGAQYRPCRTCHGGRRGSDTRPGDTCPFCGAEEVALGRHLPECDRADDYFEEGAP